MTALIPVETDDPVPLGLALRRALDGGPALGSACSPTCPRGCPRGPRW